MLPLIPKASTKYCLLIFLTFLSAKAWSTVNPILYCLGQEEARLHQLNQISAAVQLNKIMINRFLNLGNIRLKRTVVQKVCKHPDFSPSLALLRELTLNGQNIFDFSQIKGVMLVKNKRAIVKDFLQEIPQIFLSYLSSLQALTPGAGCLGQEIVEIDILTERFMSLEGLANTDDLLHRNKITERIFKKLKNFDAIYSRCEARAKAKEKRN